MSLEYKEWQYFGGTKSILHARLPAIVLLDKAATGLKVKYLMNDNVFKSLVIEDSTADQLIISKQLTPLHGVTVTVDTAEKALQLLESGDLFSLLLVDWNLPGMNGLEFVQRVRALKNGTDIKIIMITGEVEMEKVTLAIEAGVDEYLMKPITAETFKEKLRLIGIEPPLD
jgi:two-component system chemotaxis response regulator CheY